MNQIDMNFTPKPYTALGFNGLEKFVEETEDVR